MDPLKPISSPAIPPAAPAARPAEAAPAADAPPAAPGRVGSVDSSDLQVKPLDGFREFMERNPKPALKPFSLANADDYRLPTPTAEESAAFRDAIAKVVASDLDPEQKLDSLNAVSGEFGREVSGDDNRALQNAFERVKAAISAKVRAEKGL